MQSVRVLFLFSTSHKFVRKAKAFIIEAIIIFYIFNILLKRKRRLNILILEIYMKTDTDRYVDTAELRMVDLE